MVETYLVHHGILGQKWGIRRFQNEDGTLTEAGKKRQAKLDEKANKRIEKAQNKANKIIEKYGDNDYNRKIEKDLLDKARKQNEWKQKRSDYKMDESIPNKVVKTILLGPFGTYTYNSLRTTGHGRWVSAGSALATTELAGAIGNTLVSSLVADNEKRRM